MQELFFSAALPSVCEIRDKMQVVYKELTFNTGELHEKLTISCI